MPETLTIPVPDNAATPALNKRGAPIGNRNRIASGLRSFVLGRYPRGCSYVARQGHLLRRQLRDAVTESAGGTNVWSEAVIASACQHECRRLLLLRWLRIEGDALPVLDRATLLDRIGQATDSRDRCLKLLRLDIRPDDDPWASLDRLTVDPAPGAEADTLAHPDGKDDSEAVQATGVDPGRSVEAAGQPENEREGAS